MKKLLLYFGVFVLVLTMYLVLTGCDGNNPNIKFPPTTVSNGAEVKGYFQSIWGDLPSEWKQFLIEEFAGDTGTVYTDPAQVPDEIWAMMASNWADYRDDLYEIITAINDGKSPSELGGGTSGGGPVYTPEYFKITLEFSENWFSYEYNVYRDEYDDMIIGGGSGRGECTFSRIYLW